MFLIYSNAGFTCCRCQLAELEVCCCTKRNYFRFQLVAFDCITLRSSEFLTVTTLFLSVPAVLGIIRKFLVRDADQHFGVSTGKGAEIAKQELGLRSARWCTTFHKGVFNRIVSTPCSVSHERVRLSMRLEVVVVGTHCDSFAYSMQCQRENI